MSEASSEFLLDLLGIAGLAWVASAAVASGPAFSQTATAPSTSTVAPTPALAGEVVAAQRIAQMLGPSEASAQMVPQTIPQSSELLDPTGAIASYQPNGDTNTANNAFFQGLGANGRSCFTCHQPQDGWTISVQHIRDRFNASPDDPLFELIDGATCPTDDVSSLDAQLNAYSLLLGKGVIRIALPMPSSLQYKIVSVNDPSGCNTNHVIGLTSQTTGTISTYRRPLPTTGLGFLSTIMWDGREPNLLSQAVDAALVHEQGKAPPTATQQQQIVSFEGCTAALTPTACAGTPQGAGIFAAQDYDNLALDLDDAASGGPTVLSGQVANFFIGRNDPFGFNPRKTPFTPNVFTMFSGWASLTAKGSEVNRQESIARGEALFNTLPIKITGVAGLNDVLGLPTIVGTCSTCHDNPNVGNHSVSMLLNTGVTGAGQSLSPALQTDGLPVFQISCVAGPLAGQKYTVTDPGVATITGNCADIGKVKVPGLRGLAARAPYFHNGTAPALGYVLGFYEQRFGFTLSGQQEDDLINFLNAL